MQIKGGEAIAAGGFGCVFRPPLKCSSKKSTHNSSLKKNNMVSKLMIQKYGEEEFAKQMIKMLHEESLRIQMAINSQTDHDHSSK